MHTVSKRTHHYCHQCGWLGNGVRHHVGCKVEGNKHNEALTALSFAYDMLQSNGVLGTHTAATLNEVLRQYPKLVPTTSILLED